MRAEQFHACKIFGSVAFWLLSAAPAAAADIIELQMPIDCEIGRNCVIQNYVDHSLSSDARDYQCGGLTYRGHDGTDFRLPTLAAQRAGVSVRAAAHGQVLRMRDGIPDQLISAADRSSVADRECGNGVVISHGDGWETQYCHLMKDSVAVKRGDLVSAGQPLGRVGLSGLTEFPHLHLTVRHRGEIIDPFAFGAAKNSCGSGTLLWSAPLGNSLIYRERTVLNVDFSSAPVTMGQIESGETGRDQEWVNAEALVAFVRSVGLKVGDVQQIAIRAPDGQIFAAHMEAALDRNKAQSMMFVGKKRPPSGWTRGSYQASYRVTHDGRLVLEKVFELSVE